MTVPISETPVLKWQSCTQTERLTTEQLCDLSI